MVCVCIVLGKSNVHNTARGCLLGNAIFAPGGQAWMGGKATKTVSL